MLPQKTPIVITWKDSLRNEDVLERAGTRSMHCILIQKRLRWLGHLCRIKDGCIPKDLLFGELATGTRSQGRPSLRFKDICKRDLKDCGIEPADLQTANSDLTNWRTIARLGSRQAEERKTSQQRKKKKERKQKPSSAPKDIHSCTRCGRACLSRIGLYSHSRRCRIIPYRMSVIVCKD